MPYSLSPTIDCLYQTPTMFHSLILLSAIVAVTAVNGERKASEIYLQRQRRIQKVVVCNLKTKKTKKLSKARAKKLIRKGRLAPGACEESATTQKCNNDQKRCPHNYFAKRDPARNCNFEPCPCPRDGHLCPDGVTEVYRDGHSNCEFRPCPKVKSTILSPRTPLHATPCTRDGKLCPDGVTEVYRDAGNNCKFMACPRPKGLSVFLRPRGPAIATSSRTSVVCCPIEDKPKCESPQCCPTGQWSCPVSRGRYRCGRDILFSGFSRVCEPRECCDATKRPAHCSGGGCCPDGTWACPSSTSSSIFQCGSQVLNREDLSEACPSQGCCRPEARPFCKGQAGCCPDGQWTCDFAHDSWDCGRHGIATGPEHLAPLCPQGSDN